SRPLTVRIPTTTMQTSGPFCPRKPSLADILANTAPPPWTLTAFMAYLSQNHCLETLEFTMDASRYRKHYMKMVSRGGPTTPSADDVTYVRMLWQRLLDAYIAPNGPREVNLPSDVRDSILAQADAQMPPHPSTLDPAVHKVYELMEESVLVPFINSLHPQPDSAYNTSDENLHHHQQQQYHHHHHQYSSSADPASAYATPGTSVPPLSASPAHRASAPASSTSASPAS
ncbi:RGS domain-containing protein, partial [Lineolata rhizophorae]